MTKLKCQGKLNIRTWTNVVDYVNQLKEKKYVTHLNRHKRNGSNEILTFTYVKDIKGTSLA